MKTKKIVRNILLIVVAFVLLLIILAEIFKDTIIKIALEKGAKTFEVPLEVGEVDFSLVYRFPYATIEFNNLLMFGESFNDSLKVPLDTVAGISKLYASVDIVQLIKGNILVKKIDIKNVKAKYVVDSLGKSNFDFLLQETEADTAIVIEDTTKVQGVYTLDQLQLSNIDLTYIDHSLKTSAVVHVSELEMNGEVENTGFKAATKGEVVVKSLQYDDFNLDALANSQLNFDLVALNDTVQISNLLLKAGTAALNLNGSLVKKDSALVDVKFEGVDIEIAEKLSILPSKMISELKIHKAEGKVNLNGWVKGYLTDHSIPQLDVNVELAKGLVKYDTYPLTKNLELQANFTNGYATTLQSTVINIKQLHAETEKSKIDLSAKFQNPEQLQYDLSANLSANLEEIRPFVPDSLVKHLSGDVKMKIITAGMLPDSITADYTDYLLDRTKLNLSWNNVKIEMDSVLAINGLAGNLSYNSKKIKLSDFKIKVPEFGVTVSNGYVQSAFRGKISNYEQLSLQIDSLLFVTPFSYFSASGKIDGLKDIKYSLKSALNVSLAEVKQMLPDSLANSMSGEIGAKIESSGAFNVDSVADKVMPLLFENSEFYVALNNVFLNMPDTLMNVKMLSGNITYEKDSIWMDQVSGNYLGLDFSADSTSIINVYTAAIQNNAKQLLVHGNFGAGDLDYAWIEAFMVDTVALPEEEIQKKMEEEMQKELYVQKFTTKVNGNVKLESFKYGDVLAEDIDSKFLAKVDDGYFVADDLKCSVFGGDVEASVKYELSMDTSFIDVMHFKVDAKKLEVPRLLDELETYIDQEDFKKENVLGSLTGKIDGKVVLKEYNVLYEKMLLKGDIKLENGALINVKPVMDIEEIKAIKLANLDKLYFSTLESKMFLFKNEMYFPRTNIQSSSFDAMFFGMYSFGEDYAYHLKMYLNQLLSKNDRDKLDKMSKENGFEEDMVKDGKRPIYVVSSTKKTGLDNRPDRLKMDAKVNLQEQIVSFRFDPGLVLYNTEE